MASQTLDQQISSSSANGNRTAPVGAEIPVSIQGSRPTPSVGGVEQAPVPFVEQTNTVIVFTNGAVIRLSEGVFPGQILILKNLKNEREAACRVISSKSIGNVQGYVEVEFTHQTSGFWDGASKPNVAPSAAPAKPASDPLPGAADEIKYNAPNPSSHAAPSEEDAMSKALADAFSSLMSPATKSAIPEPAAAPNANAGSIAAMAPKVPSESMRSPGLSAKNPAISGGQPAAGIRSSVLSNAKPVAIGDIIGSAPVVGTFESERADASYKPPSAYRGIEPRKSSVAPEMQVRAVSRPTQSVAAPKVPQPKSGGQWVWMLAGVAASAVLMVGGFFGYRWYVGGGAPTSPAHAPATTSSSRSAAAVAPDPVSPPAAKSSANEPERVVVKATPLDPPSSGTAVNSKPASVSSPSPVENVRAAKNGSQPQFAPARQSSVLTMKTKMASPKAPNAAARQAAASNVTLPDIENSSSSASASLPTTALGGSLAAPPGGSISGSSMIQPKLVSSMAPVYPHSASMNNIEGDVRIDAIIGMNGHVGAMKVIDGPMELRQSAMVAVAQWRYEPAKLDGKAISTHLIVLVKFRLNK